MPDQPRGLYELLITEALHARLDGLDDRLINVNYSCRHE
jgi:hypothetical protein